MSPLAGRRSVAAVAIAVVVAANVAIVASAGAQAGNDAPPPTPVPPDGSLSPFPSVLRTPRDPVPPPTIAAGSALLADLEDGTVLFRRAATTPRPVASLTKVMTALVVLSRTTADEIVRVDPAAVYAPRDFGASSSLGLRPGERINVRNLLYGLLLGSANDAAEALAIHVGGTVERFVAMMNRRARALGMRDTSFASPHGLDDRGRSTAADLSILAREAHADPAFSRVVATRVRSIPAPTGPPRRIQNRNALLWLYDGAIGTKTGLTAGAGPCLMAVAERDGRRLVAIVLGASGDAFSPAASLLDHGFEGFRDSRLVRAGEDVGTVDLIGGSVPVVADADLTALVPTGQVDEVRRRIHVVRGAVFPPAPGDRVAELVVSVAGLRLGDVDLVVRSVPAPEPADGAWWMRGLGALVRAVSDAVEAVAA
ncbi:MAG TPA: D-alanyl-D-alanine carboxypeptidase family protein [Actinomycetota bacterium]|nr:D-alanyl-D-alanine carboxypeptidase family protein [Actinomycetota bacterium]